MLGRLRPQWPALLLDLLLSISSTGCAATDLNVLDPVEPRQVQEIQAGLHQLRSVTSMSIPRSI